MHPVGAGNRPLAMVVAENVGELTAVADNRWVGAFAYWLVSGFGIWDENGYVSVRALRRTIDIT